MSDSVESLMKRCQIGIGGRDARACLNDANDLLAECYGALGQQMAEIERLRRVADAADDYYEHYMQDEAEDAEACVCGREQHERAAALRDALSALKPNAPAQAPAAPERSGGVDGRTGAGC